jgi:hypothetical protein
MSLIKERIENYKPESIEKPEAVEKPDKNVVRYHNQIKNINVIPRETISQPVFSKKLAVLSVDKSRFINYDDEVALNFIGNMDNMMKKGSIPLEDCITIVSSSGFDFHQKDKIIEYLKNL